jgi:hypothetical protein
MSWAGIVNSTLRKYGKGRENLCMRDRPVYRKLLKRGKITKKIDGGTAVDWAVQMSLPTTTTWSGESLTFAQHDPNKRAFVTCRPYIVTDELTEETEKVNAGDAALIKLFDVRGPNMQQSIEEKIHEALYKDGATYTTDWHGLETLFTVDTPGAADRLAVPSSTATYGGLYTALGTYGGSCSAALGTQPNATLAKDYPEGTFDYEYAFWTPIVLNSSSTTWVGSGYTTWGDTAVRCIRQGRLWATVGNGERGAPDMCIMGSDWFYQFANAQDAKLVINAAADEDLEVSFRGFQVEGLTINTEYNCPSSKAYLLNTNQMEMVTLGSDMFDPMGPTKDPRSRSWLSSITSWGNFKFVSPKYFCKIAALA